MSLLLVWLALVDLDFLTSPAVSSHVAAGSSESAYHTPHTPPGVRVQIEPLEIVRGPDTTTDNPFNTLPGDTALLAYVGNSTTWGYLGGSPDTLRPLSQPVLQAGSSFDSCGAWLNSAWRDGTLIRGWYHAETACAYPQTHKSVAYAESYDGGRSFLKPGYPNNQVITAPPSYPSPDQDDEGDHHVIRVGDYLYLYFVAGRDWQVRLARAPVTSGGVPGSWLKYYNGAFSEPGLGGESSPLDPSGALTSSWVSFDIYLRSYLGFSYVQRDGRFAGFGLTQSPDGVNNWSALPYLVLSSEGSWDRPADDRELAAYPSLISAYGSSDQVGATFWLYYMYLNKGDGFDRRYLLRRRVHTEPVVSGAPQDLVPRIALVEYQYLDDTWFTTTSTDLNYTRAGTIGYLFTDAVPDSVPVYDCYIDFWNDHMLVPNDSTCGGGNVQYLRRAGWISNVPFTNSVRIYRCFNAAATNHFISTDPNCNGQTTEWPMGYLAQAPAVPSAQYRALSDYYSASAQDNWVTTSTPPQEYAFNARLGYLFAENERAGLIPLYDCYIDFWSDHMLAPSDATCDGSQNLGLAGWIAVEAFPGSIPIYRCFDSGATNHFVWLDPSCNGQQFEWRIGYLATQPAEVWSQYLPAAHWLHP